LSEIGPHEGELSDRTVFSAGDLRSGTPRRTQLGAEAVESYRGQRDASDVRRLRLSWEQGSLELLPSKGLSVGAYRHGDWYPFWEPVVTGLISPDAEDLTGAMLVNGEEVAAMRWVENFAGCIELLGLSNWGMPRADPYTGELLPLHGEASHVPVEEVEIASGSGHIVACGSFDVHHGWWRASEWEDHRDTRPWYQRGDPQWRVRRLVVVDTARPQLQIVDEITNVGIEPAKPDWGYHVQLRAADGARLLIPSRRVEDRFAGEVPEGFERWRPTPAPDSPREEHGYIHKGLETMRDPFGGSAVRGAALYPDAAPTCFTMPAAAYTLSWFSAGGKNTLGFARPETPEESHIPVPWDGMGPEIGASALDHDGNVDPEISHPPLAPGAALRLYTGLRQCSRDETVELEEDHRHVTRG
jgi:hypothetical protein